MRIKFETFNKLSFSVKKMFVNVISAMQTREVICKIENKTMDAKDCSQFEKPPRKQECPNEKCVGKWKVGPWSEVNTNLIIKIFRTKASLINLKLLSLSNEPRKLITTYNCILIQFVAVFCFMQRSRGKIQGVTMCLVWNEKTCG